MTVGREVAARLTFGTESTNGDCAAWIEQRLHGHLWSGQRRILDAFADNRRVAVPAAHGVGKSWLAARVIAWWIETHPVGSAFALSSAPSQTQVDAVLWRELRRAHQEAGLRGRITSGAQPRWLIGDELVALGRKSADQADAEQAAAAMQGIHAQHILVVLDEAGGIPEWLWNAAGSLLTSEDSRLLAIGNPTAGSRFEEVCS